MAELYQGWVSRFIARPGDRKRLLWDWLLSSCS